jgi:anti-sigma B factor antagonist/stage II sporulation protein AA (anti-sigma F factor antagonist)
LSFDVVGDVLVGRVEGEIESVNAVELRSALSRRLTNTTSALVLDLSSTSYLDSAGIELVFDLARRLRTHRQQLRLVVPVEAPMRRVLELCDVGSVATLDATVEAALDGLREPAA